MVLAGHGRLSVAEVAALTAAEAVVVGVLGLSDSRGLAQLELSGPATFANSHPHVQQTNKD